MDRSATVVEQELELSLVLSAEHSIPVPARLSYNSHDPFAVYITFHLDSGAPVTWVFARELLVEGTFRACGHGDVRVWPTRSGRQSILCLALSSPAGDALLEAPLPAVAAWLERAHRLVPPGAELATVDLDNSLAELLA
ncbi:MULTISPECIES: SsgA family sporulation/cell division regulator [Kitasatospora]|uniref:SsgA family sporulation/cell division regulator n=1 Tax=Kitasatospora cystarginea TaxID=58350 RepID=A0ABN3DW51_9ACTN